MDQRLAFEHPLWLLALLAAPLFWLIARRSLADFPPGQLRVQALLRTLLLAGVAVALAGPTLRRPARAVSAVAMVDVSDSVSDGALAFADQAVAALGRAAAERGDPQPRVVRFAARAEEAAGGPAIARLPPPAGAATDLALAINFGAGLVDATAIPRLLVISDGVPTRGDLVATGERLRDRGTPLYALALPSDERGDVAVVGLTAPDDVRARTPFRVDVRLLADRAAETRVRLDGAGDPHVAIDEPEQTLTLAPGATTATFTVRITEPGTATLHVRATATGGDRHPSERRGRAGDRDRTRSARSLPGRRPRGRRDRSRARWPPSTSPPTCAPRAACRATSTSAATIWSCSPTCRAPCCPTRRWRRWTASSARAAGCWSRAGRRASVPAAT